MATFIFNTDNPYAARVLAAILEQFRENPELEVTESEAGIEIKGVEVEYPTSMFPGKPMSEEDFLKRIEQSEQDYQAGKYSTSEELLNWVNSQ